MRQGTNDGIPVAYFFSNEIQRSLCITDAGMNSYGDQLHKQQAVWYKKKKKKEKEE